MGRLKGAQPAPLWSACLEHTPVGPVWAGVTASGVARVRIGYAIPSSAAGAPPTWLGEVLEQLAAYFLGRRTVFDLPLDWQDLSDFRRVALRAVQEIPYGQTRTYRQIAERIGRPQAVRAVGGANAANPLPIIVPCHRVIGSDGELHGFAAPDGIATKAALLRLEGMNGQ